MVDIGTDGRGSEPGSRISAMSCKDFSVEGLVNYESWKPPMGDQFAIIISAVLARGISDTRKVANRGLKVC